MKLLTLDSVPSLGRVTGHTEKEFPASISCAEDSPDQLVCLQNDEIRDERAFYVRNSPTHLTRVAEDKIKLVDIYPLLTSKLVFLRSTFALPEALLGQKSSAQVLKGWMESNFDQNCVVAFGSDEAVSMVRPNAAPVRLADTVSGGSEHSDITISGDLVRGTESGPSVEVNMITLLLGSEQVSSCIAFHLRNIETTMSQWLCVSEKSRLSTKHFWPMLSSSHTVGFVSFLYPTFSSLSEGRSWREHAQELMGLPLDRPFLRPSMELFRAREQVILQNVHLAVPIPSEPASIRLVNGTYSYYHYGQNLNDSGWGCAYRSLQTVASWLIFHGAAEGEVPSHSEIQQLLVDKKDKPRSFLNSSQWIGAVEVGLFIQSKYSIDYKILNAPSGDDMDSLAEQIAHHFDKTGCPIMIGGGVLAYTLLGVCIPENKSSPIRYLILDPHYVGQDRLDIIVQKGWCKWHDKSLFRKDAFYNLCLPMVPNQV